MPKHLQFYKLAILTTLVAVAAVLLVGCGGADNDSSSSTSAADSGDVTAVAVTDIPFTGGPEQGVPDTLPEPRHEDLTIGLLNPCGAAEVCGKAWGGASEQVEEYGGHPIELDARESPDTQVSQFQQLINQGVDAILVTPLGGPELLGPILKQTAAKGIPVVAMDGLSGSPGPLPGFVIDVWQQRDKMAYLEVKAAMEALGEGAKVGLITYPLPVPIFVFGAERTKYWAKKFGLDIVAEAKSKNSTIEGSQAATAGMLASNPEIEGVLAYLDEPAISAAVAARSAGREVQTFSPCCATSVGTSAIEGGRLSATVAFDAAAWGRQGVKAAYLAAQGAKLPPDVRGGGLFIVTKKNVDEVGD